MLPPIKLLKCELSTYELESADHLFQNFASIASPVTITFTENSNSGSELVKLLSDRRFDHFLAQLDVQAEQLEEEEEVQFHETKSSCSFDNSFFPNLHTLSWWQGFCPLL